MIILVFASIQERSHETFYLLDATENFVSWDDGLLNDSNKYIFQLYNRKYTVNYVNIPFVLKLKNVKLIKDEGTNIYDLFKYKNVIITSSSAKKIQQNDLSMTSFSRYSL